MNFKNVITILLTTTTLLFLTLTLYLLNERVKAGGASCCTGLHIQGGMAVAKGFNFDLNLTMIGQQALNIVCIAANANEKHLSELINEQPILIYRYAQNNCTPCYEAQVPLIQELFKEIPQRVVILASYHNWRGFLVSARNNVSEIPIYHIPFDAFDWQMEQYNVPYFFVLHPNMRISNIFVPGEREPELTIRYLESIKRLLQ